MPQARQSSASKLLFWGILILVLMGLAGIGMGSFLGGCGPWFHFRGMDHFGPHIGWRDVLWPGFIGGMLQPLAFYLVYVAVVATLVYRDAAKRGMDPWLWATIAAFVPFLIGVVIYLVVRSNGQTTCSNCGKIIRHDYKVCPYCGHHRQMLCPRCRSPIAREWKVCPFCENRLAPASGPGSHQESPR